MGTNTESRLSHVAVVTQQLIFAFWKIMLNQPEVQFVALKTCFSTILVSSPVYVVDIEKLPPSFIASWASAFSAVGLNDFQSPQPLVVIEPLSIGFIPFLTIFLLSFRCERHFSSPFLIDIGINMDVG